MTHTPTPWANNMCEIRDAKDRVVAISIYQEAADILLTGEFEGGHPEGCDEAESNAAHIVKCVNAHDKLVEALRGMVEMYVEMVNSGDCGFWDPEKQDEVMTAREALECLE